MEALPFDSIIVLASWVIQLLTLSLVVLIERNGNRLAQKVDSLLEIVDKVRAFEQTRLLEEFERTRLFKKFAALHAVPDEPDSIPDEESQAPSSLF